jgi:hypothetical protein
MWNTRDPHALFLGTWGGGIRVHRMTLVPPR